MKFLITAATIAITTQAQATEMVDFKECVRDRFISTLTVHMSTQEDANPMVIPMIPGIVDKILSDEDRNTRIEEFYNTGVFDEDFFVDGEGPINTKQVFYACRESN